MTIKNTSKQLRLTVDCYDDREVEVRVVKGLVSSEEGRDVG